MNPRLPNRPFFPQLKEYTYKGQSTNDSQVNVWASDLAITKMMPGVFCGRQAFFHTALELHDNKVNTTRYMHNVPAMAC